jgi:hypothetical protein
MSRSAALLPVNGSRTRRTKSASKETIQ